MNTKYSIKNFRAFGEDGVSIDLRPITILTGGNSSGKSSVVKSLVMLNDYLTAVKNAKEGETPRLDFSKFPMSTFGNFNAVINKDSLQKGNDTVTVEYEVFSRFTQETMIVTMTFAPIKEDLQNNGFLQRVSIRSPRGEELLRDFSYETIKEYTDPKFFRVRPRIFGVPFKGHKTQLSRYKRTFFLFSLTNSILSLTDRGHGFDGQHHTEDKIRESYEKGAHGLKEVAAVFGDDKVKAMMSYYAEHRFEANTLLGEDYDIEAKINDIASDANILMYLPILETIDSFDTKDFGTLLSGLVPEKFRNDHFLSLVLELTSDYQTSGTNSFKAYYRQLEEDFLDYLEFDNSLLMRVPYFEFPQKHYNLDGSLIKNDITPSDRFSKVFCTLASIDPEADRFVHCIDNPISGMLFVHKLCTQFIKYRNGVIKDIFTADYCEGLKYVGSSRIVVKRLYDLTQADEFSKTLIAFFDAVKDNPNNPYGFINKWIDAFGIGKRFAIEALPEGIGFFAKIYKDEKDKEGQLLADFGYGISQFISILLEIQTTILKAKTVGVKKEEPDFSIEGMKKVFDSDLDEKYLPITIAIEEPEIHLHPRFQSLLADMIVDAYKTYNINFIIETHSEYLIRKMQTMVASNRINSGVISLNYVDETASEKIRRIEFAPDGRLKDAFGPGFYDEADTLAMNLLMIKGGCA